MRISVAELLQFARISEMLVTRVSPQLMALKMVAWGLVAPQAKLLGQCDCQVRLIAPPIGQKQSEPVVSYHLIAACGTSFIQKDLPPGPPEPVKIVPSAPLMAAFNPPEGPMVEEDGWLFAA